MALYKWCLFLKSLICFKSRAWAQRCRASLMQGTYCFCNDYLVSEHLACEEPVVFVVSNVNYYFYYYFDTSIPFGTSEVPIWHSGHFPWAKSLNFLHSFQKKWKIVMLYRPHGSAAPSQVASSSCSLLPMLHIWNIGLYRLSPPTGSQLYWKKLVFSWTNSL